MITGSGDLEPAFKPKGRGFNMIMFILVGIQITLKNLMIEQNWSKEYIFYYSY